MEAVVTNGAITRAKLQSNRHHQQTNTQLFTARMLFLSPNQQCQSTEGINSDTYAIGLMSWAVSCHQAVLICYGRKLGR